MQVGAAARVINDRFIVFSEMDDSVHSLWLWLGGHGEIPARA